MILKLPLIRVQGIDIKKTILRRLLRFNKFVFIFRKKPKFLVSFAQNNQMMNRFYVNDSMSQSLHAQQAQKQSQEFEQIQELDIDEITQIKEALKIIKSQYKNNLKQQQQQQRQPQLKQNVPNYKELALLTNHTNKSSNIHFMNSYGQKQSQQVVRKSRRLKQKSQNKSLSAQPLKSHTSMIKKVQKQKKSEQTKQFNRPFVERIKNPGNPTLRQTNVVFRNNQFYYSISIKSIQYCTKHRIQKKTQQNNLTEELQHLKIQSQTCKYCKKPGMYWFSSTQLLKFNNGNFIRKYLETFM